MLEKIRESCEYVSLNSKYVSINYKELDNFIKTLGKEIMYSEPIK